MYTYQPNPFSKSIEFRPGGPIQLLDYLGLGPNEPGAILIDENALRILKDIEEPIAVITIAGSYRRGKSYFANTLLGRHDGFKLGSSVEGCTKGIDMWNTPFLYEGKRVVVLDCEGIDDPKQEVPWASKLFILCLAISSTFILNINGVIGRDDIGKLCLMTDIASHIQPPSDSKFSPNLVVLLRDFQFDKPPDFVKYFLDNLSRVNDDAAKGVKDFFGEFKVHAIPGPGIHQEAMRDMSTIETEQLDPVFVNKIEEAVNDVFQDLPPKYLDKSTMTGTAFATFLEDCVKQMNSPENDMPLSIPCAYEATTHYVAQRAHETCLKNYEDMMDTQFSVSLPISWDEFDIIHIAKFEIVANNFLKKIVGSAEQIRSFQERFYEKILDSKKKFYKMNSEAIYKQNNGWAHTLWKENVTHGLMRTNLFTSDQYLEAIDLFEQIYGTVALPGEEAGQVLSEFKDRQYKDAVETLKYHGALHELLVDEISVRQQAERKYYNIVQKERQLQTEISNYKNEKEKIQQQFEVKIKNLEENFRNQKPDDQGQIRRLKEEHRKMYAKIKDDFQEKLTDMQEQLNKTNSKKNEFWGRAGEAAATVAVPIIINLVAKLFGVPFPLPFP